jgi:LPXTG-motif cell wall-anchored protein
MTRILVVLLATFLLLAPAAAAKGPHVILDTAQKPVKAGKAWEATLEFNEIPRLGHPVLTATNRGRSVTAALGPVTARGEGAASVKARTVFPSAGRWEIAVTVGARRFKFPAVDVGTRVMVLDYVAFAEGSMADRQGGSGPYQVDEGPSGSAPDTSLPPEVISYADAHPGEDGDGGGPEPWLFALGGVMLAGAGVVTLRRRK